MRDKAQLDQYKKRKKDIFAHHPKCEMCGRKATDIHHKAGRTGFLLTYEKLWALLCRKCHDRIHFGAQEGYGPKWARENGWLVNLSYNQFCALRDEGLTNISAHT